MKTRHLILALLALLPACSRSPSRAGDVHPGSTPASPGGGAQEAAITADTAGASAVDDHQVGAPRTFDNLTVFPITSKSQVDVGPLLTLEEALKKGVAEIREVGAERREEGPQANEPVNQLGNRGNAIRGGGGPRVNTLVIENKGVVPVYVLAGTVVKGGNQDRQIGQDFIVDGKQVAAVDAFCVEHGRWSAERNGQATGGKFGTMAQLTGSGVRAAGQYKKNQSEVWAKVADVNAANKKSAASGTLLATLDDQEMSARRAALAGKAAGYLDSIAPAGSVVGLAYAVGGKVRAVRWFASSAVFTMFKATLLNTAATDALTAQAEQVPGQPPPAVAPIGPEAVAQFIAQVESAKVDESRDTAAGNVNEYQQSDRAYGSKTLMKLRAAATAAPNAPPAATAPAKKGVAISADFVAK